MALEIICYRAGGGESKENTISGIEHCIKTNPSWRIEIDLQLTKDHKIVLLHDSSLLRTHGLDINIGEISYDQLVKRLPESNLDQIPTLKSVLSIFPSRRWVFDLHSSHPIIVTKLLLLLENSMVDSTSVIVSEHDKLIKQLIKQKSKWRHASATNETRKVVFLNKLRLGNLYTSKSDIHAIPKRVGCIPILTPRLIRESKSKDKQVWMFGDDLKKIMKNRRLNLPISSQKYSLKALKELESMGIDAVFTDFPFATKQCMSQYL